MMLSISYFQTVGLLLIQNLRSRLTKIHDVVQWLKLKACTVNARLKMSQVLSPEPSSLAVIVVVKVSNQNQSLSQRSQTVLNTLVQEGIRVSPAIRGRVPPPKKF